MVKSAWLDDVQGSVAGQFGAWLCVGKIIVLDGCKVMHFENNFSSIVKIQLTTSVAVFVVFCTVSQKRNM